MFDSREMSCIGEVRLGGGGVDVLGVQGLGVGYQERKFDTNVTVNTETYIAEQIQAISRATRWNNSNWGHLNDRRKETQNLKTIPVEKIVSRRLSIVDRISYRERFGNIWFLIE